MNSEPHLAAALRSIGDAVIVTDPRGRVTLMNRVAETFIGSSEAEVKGQRLNEILLLRHSGTGDFLTNSFSRVLSARATVHLPPNAVLHSRDGTERWIDCTGTPIHDDAGECLGAILVLHDVTEKALAEAALRASQELFRQITENVTDIIAIFDLNGRRVFQSRGSKGLVREGVPEGVDGFADVAPADRERVRDTFRLLVTSGVPQRVEYRWMKPDGVEIVVESEGTLIRDEHGHPTRVLVVSRDVTQRRGAEERLRREMEFTESLLTGLPGIFFLCDVHFRLLRWNRNLETVSGLTPAELGTLDVRDLLLAADRVLFEQRTLRCFAEGKMDVEVHVRPRMGHVSAYYISGLQIAVSGGRAMFGIGIDISARKAAEESLRAMSHRLERQNLALAEQARNPVLREDDLAQAYRAITEVAAKTLGVSRASVWLYDEDCSSLRCADLFERATAVHSSGQQLRRAECPRYFDALAEGRVIPAHYARNDPRTRELADTYLKPLGITSMLDAPIRPGGRMIGVICHEHTGSPREWTLDEQNFARSMADLIALSIERAQRREAERANERLQELDRLRSEFLAMMSHELRTPLNSIIGFTGILRQGLAGPLNEEQCKQLGMVQSSARHLLSLINDLLDLSRIEAGKMDVVPERFRVEDVVSEVSQSLSPLVAQKRLQWDVRIADPALEMHSDRKKLFQILLNLANNAAKFTDRGSIGINVQGNAETVFFEVTDTGIGIKPDQMSRLFQPFGQTDGSPRRMIEGTGLGLYLCRKLVTLLGGSIGVRSEFGCGACFHLTVPQRLGGPR